MEKKTESLEDRESRGKSLEKNRLEESRAKEILDRLARRVGFDCLVARENGIVQLYALEDCLFRMLYFDGTVLSLKFFKTPREDLHKQVLEDLLELSAEGHDIMFFDPKYRNRTPQKMHVFLPAYSTLESVLISLDLEGLEGEKRNA